MNISRRHFSKILASGALLAGSKHTLANKQRPERRIKLHNLHTGEKIDVVYWSQGHYNKDSLDQIDALLRDHRNDHLVSIDSSLLDALTNLQQRLQSRREIQIISAYRSPETNALLRKQGHGVAKRSFHMFGKAIDFRIPGQKLSDVRLAALSLRSGGVGYYPQSNFVHLDSGRIRHW